MLVVEAPADPVYPPPSARRLADALGDARLVTVPGMGYALPAAVLTSLADAIEAHRVSPRGAADRPG